MATNLKKYVTSNLLEFLLLSVDPNLIFKNDAVKKLHSIIICYDIQHFYNINKCITNNNLTTTSVRLDEFSAYCDSKVKPKYFIRQNGYHCSMTVADVLKIQEWANLYLIIGPTLMKFLLFDCLIFVPLSENVYFCVDSPSHQCNRYEIIKTFWSISGSLKIITKWQRNTKECKKEPKCYKIAEFFNKLNEIGKTNVEDILTQIRNIDIGLDKIKLDELYLKPLEINLKKLVHKDQWSCYNDIFNKAVSEHSHNEIPLNRIKQFAVSVVQKVIPFEMFGTNVNRNQFCKNLSKIFNCGLTHNFTVEQIVYKMKYSSVKWLKCNGEPGVIRQIKSAIFKATLVWLTSFVLSRIARCFQVVRSNVSSYGVAYFTMPYWKSITDKKLFPLTKNGFFQEITNSSDSSLRKWRICPYAKAKGIRLIFKRRAKIEEELMDDCLVFLRCLSYTYSRTKSIDKVKFFESWQSLRSCLDQTHKIIYYVRTDFQDAFTSIKQKALLSVLRNAIKQYYGASSQSLQMHTVDVVKYATGNKVRCKRVKFFDGLPTPTFSGGSLMFHRKSVTVSLSKIWAVIKKCVEGNVVTLYNRSRIMTRGIIQGDRLSMILCDIFLADLQSNVIRSYVSGPSRLLYRFMDDYLFVSFDKKSAEDFLAVMNAGFEAYGLTINKEKTETNLYGISEGGGTVRFLGFCINIDTGEVTKDVQLFRRKRPLHFFNYNLGVKSGQRLYQRLTNYAHYPVPAVLLSKVYNTTGTVVRNLAILICHKAFGAIFGIKQYFSHVNNLFLWCLIRDVGKVIFAKIYSARRISPITPMQSKWIVYEVYKKMLQKYLNCNTSLVITHLRAKQAVMRKKCNVTTLELALKHYDFLKMFD
ncbi:uncharacterized protein LOC126901167 [Daktulosphaira vitifoliae]|uniref:uncharacterized protein LOC126901167 n=1 Tax=Daktulosphaira vitifoliae TaxID=58002 RepID=UPI0021A9E0E9|nr:uncharacterized protein LOC126901167 [Daktulosphaira vitifoliae]